MSAFEASAEIADIVRRYCTVVPAKRLLVVAHEELGTLGFSGVAHQSAVYRLPENPTQIQTSGPVVLSRDRLLPFTDRAFDIVVFYRLTSRADELQRLLRETGRILRPEGAVIIVAHENDFSFAPLPDIGRAHLLRRWLSEAGFAAVDFPPLTDSRVVAIAHASRVGA